MALRKFSFPFLMFLFLVAASYISYAQDFDSPELSSLTVSPSTIDISSGGVTVTLSIQASDASGITVGSSRPYLVNEHSTQILNNDFYFSPWQRVSGNQYNGVYEAKKFINPSNVPSQTYRINPAASTFEDPAGLEASSAIGFAYLQINRSDCTITYSQNATSFTTTETILGFGQNNTVFGQHNTVFTLDETCTENDPYLENVNGLPNGLFIELIFFDATPTTPAQWSGVITGTAETGTQGSYSPFATVSN